MVRNTWSATELEHNLSLIYILDIHTRYTSAKIGLPVIRHYINNDITVIVHEVLNYFANQIHVYILSAM